MPHTSEWPVHGVINEQTLCKICAEDKLGSGVHKNLTKSNQQEGMSYKRGEETCVSLEIQFRLVLKEDPNKPSAVKQTYTFDHF